jgi:uncharacterized protein (DUF1697 family)
VTAHNDVYVALLRAVNVGGRMVAMADLRALCTKLGFPEAQTLLQSGNLVVRAAATSSAALERLLEAETRKQLRLETDFLVRTPTEWRAVIARNPFPKEAVRDPGRLLVLFLKDAPAAARVKALQAAITGRETVRVVGRQLYVVYPDGVGRSRLTLGLIERTFSTRGTGRNWNTVRKLAALVAG